MADKIKLFFSALLVAAGVWGFYHFADQALWIRVLGLLVLVALAIVVAAQSEPGRGGLAFVRDARTEVRKVVWPTRKETVQTSMMVVAMVIVVAILLWAMDSVLFWLVRTFVTGQGS